MILVQGSAQIHADDAGALRDAASWMIPATRGEEGCLHYAWGEDALTPGLFHVVERWRDEAAMQAHLASAHMARLGGVLGRLRVQALRIVAYDGANERVILGG